MERKGKNIIFKFKLDQPNAKGYVRIVSDGWTFERILSARADENDIYVWALMRQLDNYESDEIIRIVPTGYMTFDERFMTYIDTVFLKNGEIYHIFSSTCYEGA